MMRRLTLADAERWLKIAEECTTTAETATDAGARLGLLECAASYRHLAAMALDYVSQERKDGSK